MERAAVGLPGGVFVAGPVGGKCAGAGIAGAAEGHGIAVAQLLRKTVVGADVEVGVGIGQFGTAAAVGRNHIVALQVLAPVGFESGDAQLLDAGSARFLSHQVGSFFLREVGDQGSRGTRTPGCGRRSPATGASRNLRSTAWAMSASCWAWGSSIALSAGICQSTSRTPAAWSLSTMPLGSGHGPSAGT